MLFKIREHFDEHHILGEGSRCAHGRVGANTRPFSVRN